MMIHFVSLRKTILLFTLSFLSASCAINPVTGQHELMLISEQQEVALGEEASPSLRWEFGGDYRDSALESYLGAIVEKIWRNSERPQLPYRFSIQNTSVPNAFALPGYVAITRGLLSELENEAQFASVIGHEIGHVMARHTAQRLSQQTLHQLGLAIGASALNGSGGGDALMTIGAIGSKLILLKYDRSQELQADKLGVKYMAMLGYDPYEAKKTHIILERVTDDYLRRLGRSQNTSTPISDLLSTHPRQEVRLSEIDTMIRSLPPYSLYQDGKHARQYQDATGNMRATNRVYFIYDEAEQAFRKKNFTTAESKVRQAIGENSRQAPFHALLGSIKVQTKDYAIAESAFNSALSLNPGYQPAVFGLGLVRYYEGSYSRAIDAFKQSLKLYPNHGLSYYGIGKSYFKLHEYREATPYLVDIARIAPRDVDVHGMLGICYDSLGEIKPAVIAYRNQITVAPDTELGRHARKRLAVLSPLLQ
ncbi:MAG: M48 family metalloprotease [Nitrospiraceae bacterium]|nr:MAG: M48 family metalloprotease [Nitrospiraceae bacterium]